MTREEKFDALFRQHYAAVLRYLQRRVGPDDAADVAGEVFLVLWRRLDDVALDAPLLWLYRVAYHTLANHRRSEHRRDRLTGELAAALRSRTPDDEADHATARVREALATLRREDRELLTLIAWEGLSPSEVATVLEISPGTARVRLHRARSRLRKALGPPTSDDAVAHPCLAPSA